MQGTAVHPTETVHVDGQVKVPGEYPLEPGMKVADLVRAGGGAADAAYGAQAELTRYSVAGGESRQTQLIEVNLASALRGDPAANVVLQAYDTLTVKEVPQWSELETVVLKGEVRFPGSYAIRRGETLKSVIERAGGLTNFAFPEGSVFTREGCRSVSRSSSTCSRGACRRISPRSRCQCGFGSRGRQRRRRCFHARPRSVVAGADPRRQGGGPPGDRPATADARAGGLIHRRGAA